jgi:hypothetical protein
MGKLQNIARERGTKKRGPQNAGVSLNVDDNKQDKKLI